MDDPFVTAHVKALENYIADLDQLEALHGRLITSVKGLRKEKSSDQAKLGKFNTVKAQLERIPVARREAEARFLKAKNDANELYVIRVKGLAAYCMGVGKDDAATRLLASICKDFEGAKGDFPRRQALYDEVSATMSAAVAALDKQEGPDNSILGQLDRIDDPERASAFYRSRREEILSAFDSSRRNTDNQQP